MATANKHMHKLMHRKGKCVHWLFAELCECFYCLYMGRYLHDKCTIVPTHVIFQLFHRRPKTFAAQFCVRANDAMSICGAFKSFSKMWTKVIKAKETVFLTWFKVKRSEATRSNINMCKLMLPALFSRKQSKSCKVRPHIQRCARKCRKINSEKLSSVCRTSVAHAKTFVRLRISFGLTQLHLFMAGVLSFVSLRSLNMANK